MTRSRKKNPGTTWACCKSQKKGKQMASRKFRRRSRTELASGRDERLPLKSIELTSPWDLGGDGKVLHNLTGRTDDDIRKIMAK